MTADRIVLPIVPSYVPGWGTWEVVREVLQNAKDEEEQGGHPMVVTYDDGVLRVSNVGAALSRRALMLGQTAKADRTDLRGQFGEGLDLALLVGARLGLDMEVRTPVERWTPAIEPAAQYDGAECLVVHVAPDAYAGVQVQLRLDRDVWDVLPHLCLFLGDDERETVTTDDGTILLDSRYRGHVYAKGIFVQRLEGLRCGYDLAACPLDRDRRMVDAWDFQWMAGRMHREAVKRSPARMVPELYRMLRDDVDDVRALRHQGDREVAEVAAAAFRAEHGTDAMPATSVEETVRLQRAGKKAVVVPEGMAQLLRQALGTVDGDASGKEVLRRYAWGDMTAEEQQVLRWAAGVVQRATTADGMDRTPLLERLQVVEFHDGALQGLTDGTRIMVPHRLLVNRLQLVASLIHEEAHAVGGDCTRAHVDQIERLWIAAYREALECDQTRV